MGLPPLILLFTFFVFVMMIFVLVVILTGAAQYAHARLGTATTPHVTIAFVGNTSPIAGIDHVSVAGIATYNASD